MRSPHRPFEYSSLSSIMRPVTRGLCLCLLSLLGFVSSTAGAASNADDIAAFAQSLDKTRSDFVQRQDFAAQLQRLLELEKQALALIEDEPLKMGSLGSAILDIYPASQTGHLAMQRYYEHLEAKAPGNLHAARLAAIQTAMLATGSGRATSPYRVMSIYDASAFAESKQLAPVGSIYQSSEHATFGLLLIARPDEAKLRQIFFDLTHLLDGFDLPASPADEPHAGQPSHPSPWALIRRLATDMDSAAQTAIGAYLANIKKYDDAIGWLKVASRTGNVLANTLLARIYWSKSEAAVDDEQDELRELALENHLHAIALGSTDSMYTLASLYFGDFYGTDNSESAITLLKQAGDLGHAESLLYLAHLYNTGQHVELDQVRAQEYFSSAAQLGNSGAVLSYGRFLTVQAQPVDADEPIFALLGEMMTAKDDRAAEAMVVMGNLHARRVAPKASNRRAVRWYKRAVKTAPDNADIINEVAWTLTVSDVEGLPRARYARRLMDKLMDNVEDARTRPEYLDTWAAANAADGNFERAIELQNTAIEVATRQARDDVLEILKDHLEQFEAGSTITEPAP